MFTVACHDIPSITRQQLRMQLLLCDHHNPAEADDAPDSVMQLSSVGVWAPVMALMKRSASLTMFWPTPALMRLYISPAGSNAYAGTMWRRLLETAGAFGNLKPFVNELGGELTRSPVLSCLAVSRSQQAAVMVWYVVEHLHPALKCFLLPCVVQSHSLFQQT
jgi:hypothetical protein